MSSLIVSVGFSYYYRDINNSHGGTMWDAISFGTRDGNISSENSLHIPIDCCSCFNG